MNVPRAVERGEDANFICNYNLDADQTLYSVKWYKGRREFYRFTPNEIPPMKTFPIPGISVFVSIISPISILRLTGCALQLHYYTPSRSIYCRVLRLDPFCSSQFEHYSIYYMMMRLCSFCNTKSILNSRGSPKRTAIVSTNHC